MKNTAKTNLVVFNENVKLLFFELIDNLYQKGYFGFLDEAKKYVTEMEHYFKSEIPKLHQLGLSKKATPYFEKYGEEIYFIAYKRIKTRTTWYAFYEIFNKRYFKVIYITNNHTKEAAYIEHIL